MTVSLYRDHRLDSRSQVAGPPFEMTLVTGEHETSVLFHDPLTGECWRAVFANSANEEDVSPEQIEVFRCWRDQTGNVVPICRGAKQ